MAALHDDASSWDASDAMQSCFVRTHVCDTVCVGGRGGGRVLQHIHAPTGFFSALTNERPVHAS